MLVQFNSKSLHPLINTQCNNPQEIIDNLDNCQVGFWESKSYFHCLDTSKSDDDLQFKDSILLQGHEKGNVVLDISNNGNIAGIEFIDL